MADDANRYLRDVQYRAPDRLEARSRLHRKYGRADWFKWLAREAALPPGGRCLDLGCGAGAFWRDTPRSVPDDLRVHLVDLSPGMVEAALHAARAADSRREVTGEVADAAALPLPDGAFDAVLAVHMLYHLADPGAGAAEIARVLASGGVASVVLNPRGDMAELSRLVDEALDRAPNARREPLTAEEAEPLLRAHFPSVEAVRFENRLDCTDPADVLAYLLSLPVADRPDAPDRLAAAVDRAFLRGGGRFTIGKAAVLLRCRRYADHRGD